MIGVPQPPLGDAPLRFSYLYKVSLIFVEHFKVIFKVGFFMLLLVVLGFNVIMRRNKIKSLHLKLYYNLVT